MALCREALPWTLVPSMAIVPRRTRPAAWASRSTCDEDVGEGVEVDLAESADGAEVGPVVADDGQEGEVAFAGQGDLAAGEDADAVGVEQQTGHHGGIEGRGAAGLVLVEGIDPGEVEVGDDIEEEEDEVVLRELGGGGVGLLGVGFGVQGR